MDNLEYKGTKGTRFKLIAASIVVVTATFFSSEISADQWLDYLVRSLGIYASSEAAAKAASAYGN